VEASVLTKDVLVAESRNIQLHPVWRKFNYVIPEDSSHGDVEEEYKNGSK
jgi:hypothetical protein